MGRKDVTKKNIKKDLEKNTKKDLKKEEIRFENAPVQLLVNPKETEKPFTKENEDVHVHESLKEEDVNESLKEEDVHESLKEEDVHESLKEEDVNESLKEEDVNECEDVHECKDVHEDEGKEDVHECEDVHHDHHLSLVDKITLFFFAFLNSLGNVFKKVYNSFLRFFSKQEESEQV